MSRSILSDKTILAWPFYSAGASVAPMIVCSIVSEVAYDCWPLGGIRSCTYRVPIWLMLCPPVLGAIIGTSITVVLARKQRK